VQVASSPDALHATRIATGEARLVIGCDAIVSASNDVLSRTQHGVTVAAINSGATPTAEFVKNPKWTFPGTQTEAGLRDSIGEGCAFIDANALALKLLGDTIYSNPLLLGFAWQKGWLPLQLSSLVRAIELNGVSVEKNQQAFSWGRYIAHHGEAAVQALLKPAAAQQAIVMQMPESLDKLIASREALLTTYQDAAYAQRYRTVIDRIRAKETQVAGNAKLPLTRAVATGLAKLMAYKDEYEVARLYADPAYLDKLRQQFEGEPGRDYKLSFHLAPPLLAKRDERGNLQKKSFGPWMLPVFRMLARMKGLRGTALDVFGKTAERRGERQLIAEYIALVDELAPKNRALLAERDRLQQELDGWHRAHPGPIRDMSGYRDFLERIGYLVPPPTHVQATTTNVDREIAEQAGPQLVVPVSNARYALNAANARWGSLYDALYGTDAIPETAGAKGATFNEVRGKAVIAHPGRYPYKPAQRKSLFGLFKDLGGQGMEVVTGSHTPEQYRQYARVAREYGFEASRGSDFHAPGAGRVDLGGLPDLPPDLVPVWHDWVGA